MSRTLIWTGAIEYSDGGPQPRELGPLSRGIRGGRMTLAEAVRLREMPPYVQATLTGEAGWAFSCVSCGRAYPAWVRIHCPVCIDPPLPRAFRGRP